MTSNIYKKKNDNFYKKKEHKQSSIIYKSENFSFNER